MPAPSLTYTLTNGNTADATQVMQNFTDILNGVSDGTKDLSINALTAAGAATLNGHVTLGNAAADDLTINASLASSIPVKTTATYNIGAATLGLLSVYFGRNSQTTRVIGSATMSATYTLTLPASAGTKGYVPYNSDGSATLTWTHGQTGVYTSTDESYTVLDGDGYKTILVSTGASNRTPVLPTAADNAGREITFKKIDTGAGYVVIEGEGAETINGTANFTLNYQYDWVTLVCDGTAWHSIAKNQVTNWMSYTPTGDWVSNTTYSGKFRRNGSDLDGQIVVQTSAAPTATALDNITLPSGLTIDVSELADSTPSGDSYIVGQATLFDDSTGTPYPGATHIDVAASSTLTPLAHNAATVDYSAITASNIFIFANLDQVIMRFSVPISEWVHWAK
jgi:hypothetical protein